MDRNSAEIRHETIETFRARLERLRGMQPQHGLTQKHAVGVLSHEIDALLKRGFAMTEIADQLTQERISIAPRALRAYRSRSELKRNKAAAKARLEKLRVIPLACSPWQE